MRLVPELAKKIVNEVQLVMTEDTIVVDQNGNIIASTDSNRVGTFHEGANIVMKTKKKLYINEEFATHLQGVKPGINLPIIYENDVIGVIGITGIPKDIEPFAELIRRMTELIIREANYIEKKEWKTRGLESFFYEWLYNQDVDEEFIHRGEILGISFNNAYLCILIQLDSQLSQEKLKNIQFLLNSWFTTELLRDQDDYLVQWGQDRFVLLKSAKRVISMTGLQFMLETCKQYFANHHQTNLSIGVGKTVESKYIYSSYQEAKKALKVAEKNNSVVFYDSLLLEIILEEINEKTKNEFIHRVLSSIKEDDDLIETLKTYFYYNQSLKNTADALHIHINTLHYRLKQIRDITNIDPKSAEGTTLFYIALSYYQLDKQPKTQHVI